MHRLTILACAMLTALSIPGTALAGPVRPRYAPVIGSPRQLAAYWHDQRWQPEDFNACALYAQAALLEAFGYDFAAELENARLLGRRDGWYDPDQGAIGLGQPLYAKGIRYEAFGTPLAGDISPGRALYRLQAALSLGRYVIVNIDAQQLSHYRGSVIKWHTIWITGMRFEPDGTPATVIANDSYNGAGVEYPVDEFLAAWGNETFNYYGIFVYPPT